MTDRIQSFELLMIAAQSPCAGFSRQAIAFKLLKTVAELFITDANSITWPRAAIVSNIYLSCGTWFRPI